MPLDPTDPEVIAGSYPFPATQEAFEGTALRLVAAQAPVGWYDTSVREERGPFCVVRVGADLDDLVGEFLIFTSGSRVVYAYCLAAADVPTDLALARRAYLALAELSTVSVPCTVEVRT